VEWIIKAQARLWQRNFLKSRLPGGIFISYVLHIGSLIYFRKEE